MGRYRSASRSSLRGTAGASCRLAPRLATLVAVVVSCSAAPALAGILGMQKVASGLNAPVFMTHAPGDPDRLFIVERGSPVDNSNASAAIRVLNLRTGVLEAEPFLTIPGVNTNGEGGLLGLAFHPDYQTNGKFYVNLTAEVNSPPQPFDSQLREYQVSDNPNIARAEFDYVHLWARPGWAHVGGWIGFSPHDNYLYVTSGDGGAGNNDPLNAAQSLESLLGKVLRIDVDGDDFPQDPLRNYKVPATNPFVGVDGSDEIWAFGLRNPYRASFDRETGDLWMGDVGQSAREEINFQSGTSEGGENYGWRIREGTIANPTNGIGGPHPPGAVDPIYEYSHDVPIEGRAIIGGYVYRGPDPELQGMYFYADTGDFGPDGTPSKFWAFDPADPVHTNVDVKPLLTSDVGSFGYPVSFGEDAAGNLYIAFLGTNDIYRIVTEGPREGADSDGDDDVDGADLLAGQRSSFYEYDLEDFTTNFGPSADLDGDHDVDGGDFLAGQRDSFQVISVADFHAQFGRGETFGGVPTPEPSSLLLALLTAGWSLRSVGRRVRRD